jgi:two-component system sensor histidine kinase BaeS
LARTAGRIGAGERGVPVPESGTREVAEVADALRHLDAALSASEERQRHFLRSVSHELRTPLTAIRGYAESLADGSVAPDELAGVGDILVAEAGRLERYVDDLLALARLEGPELSLTFADTRLGDLLDDARAAWAERCERAGVVLRVDLAEDVAGVVVSTDAGRLRQVLDILTDNAVRVCPAGSTVVWAAGTEPDGVRLEVRDSGPGLSDDDLDVAFEPGALRDRYAATRPVGQGLGLATAHGLVVRLGGALTAGRAPEGGAAFVVRLPWSPR